MRSKAYLLAFAAAIALSGCAIFGTSKAERVARLEFDLNDSRQYAYQNFDPATTADYTKLATQPPSQTWDQWFPLEASDTEKYALEVQDVSSDSLTARVTGPADFNGPQTLSVGLVRLGMDWYINRLQLSGSAGLIVQ